MKATAETLQSGVFVVLGSNLLKRKSELKTSDSRRKSRCCASVLFWRHKTRPRSSSFNGFEWKWWRACAVVGLLPVLVLPQRSAATGAIADELNVSFVCKQRYYRIGRWTADMRRIDWSVVSALGCDYKYRSALDTGSLPPADDAWSRAFGRAGRPQHFSPVFW